MKKKDLFDYLATLTPEQKEKIIKQLHQLRSLLEESNPPYHQER